MKIFLNSVLLELKWMPPYSLLIAHLGTSVMRETAQTSLSQISDYQVSIIIASVEHLNIT